MISPIIAMAFQTMIPAPEPFMLTCMQSGGQFGIIHSNGTTGPADRVILESGRPVLLSVSFAQSAPGPITIDMEWRHRPGDPVRKSRVDMMNSMTIEASWAQVVTRFPSTNIYWCARAQPLPN